MKSEITLETLDSGIIVVSSEEPEPVEAPKSFDGDMSNMKLNDIEIGKIKPVRRYDYKSQEYTDLVPRDVFLETFEDKKEDWKTKEVTQTLFHRYNNLPQADAFHKNYMEYLETCWGDHLGVVFSPDILWYMVLGELVEVVKGSPEEYRHLFSESDEKQEILVFTDERVVMPLSLLIEGLKDKVPTDSDVFMPEFSTSSMRSKHAMIASFCDMCSPYYNYSMMLCGLPCISVRGSADDYKSVKDNWDKLAKLFDIPYMRQAGTVISSILTNLNNPEFWGKMFDLEKCGSGGDKVVKGWITQLFRELPSLAYPNNFSSQVAKVSYKDKPTDKNYEMYDGLFFSKMEGDFLVPNFGSVVNELTT